MKYNNGVLATQQEDQVQPYSTMLPIGNTNNSQSSNLSQMDHVQFKTLTALKQKVRALKIESIRLHGDAFKMQHEFEQMVDQIKLSKDKSDTDGKADVYDTVCQGYLDLLFKISQLKPLEQVNSNFGTLLANVVSQVDKAQRKVRQLKQERAQFYIDRIA